MHYICIRQGSEKVVGQVIFSQQEAAKKTLLFLDFSVRVRLHCKAYTFPNCKSLSIFFLWGIGGQ